MRSVESYVAGSAGAVVLFVSVLMSAGCAEQAASDNARVAGDLASAPVREVAVEEEDFQTLVARGSARMVAGSWDEAVADLSRALTMEAGNREVTFKLGTSLLQTARYREALALLEPLREEGAAESASLLNNIAWACLKATDPAVRSIQKALKYARQAVIEDHDDPDIWGTLAEAHYAAGNRDEAFRAARIAAWSALVSGAANMGEFSELLRRCSWDVSPMETGRFR
jgi:tetratricopeptide (TPR) repeat protein